MGLGRSRAGALGVAGQGLSKADAITLGGGIYGAGDQALDEVAPKKPLPHR